MLITTYICTAERMNTPGVTLVNDSESDLNESMYSHPLCIIGSYCGNVMLTDQIF